jgi:hypothetical protein
VEAAELVVVVADVVAVVDVADVVAVVDVGVADGGVEVGVVDMVGVSGAATACGIESPTPEFDAITSAAATTTELEPTVANSLDMHRSFVLASL